MAFLSCLALEHVTFIGPSFYLFSQLLYPFFYILYIFSFLQDLVSCHGCCETVLH